MFCQNCGQMIPEQSKFCRFCGSRQNAPEAGGAPFVPSAPPVPPMNNDRFAPAPGQFGAPVPYMPPQPYMPAPDNGQYPPMPPVQPPFMPYGAPMQGNGFVPPPYAPAAPMNGGIPNIPSEMPIAEKPQETVPQEAPVMEIPQEPIPSEVAFNEPTVVPVNAEAPFIPQETPAVEMPQETIPPEVAFNEPTVVPVNAEAPFISQEIPVSAPTSENTSYNAFFDEPTIVVPEDGRPVFVPEPGGSGTPTAQLGIEPNDRSVQPDFSGSAPTTLLNQPVYPNPPVPNSGENPLFATVADNAPYAEPGEPQPLPYGGYPGQVYNAYEMLDPNAPTVRKEKKPVNKKALIIILCAVGAALLIGGLLLFLLLPSGGVKSPDALAESYVEAFNTHDTDKLGEYYLPDCLKVFNEEYDDAGIPSYLYHYDEFYKDFGDCNITAYEVTDVTEYDADSYANMTDRYGMDISSGARISLSVSADGKEVSLHLFAVKSGGGWYLYKTSDWF